MQKQANAARRPLSPGERFGRLVVVRQAEKPKRDRSYLCRCNCGLFTVVPSHALKSGNTRSCGCLKREKVPHDFNVTHGHTRYDRATGQVATTPTYRAWHAMRSRCNSKGRHWEWYGARGITIHPSWRGRGGFEQFLSDMGEKPDWATGGLDRIDPDGNYEPANCRWATREMQANNKRPSAHLSEIARLEAVIKSQRQEIARLKEL